ncbi:hypothetical protein CABS01_16577 [Colletotrichum abscissum]|uniref:uncharacterized protein n=1 Tax=Colletotrichum abscissum TaxID=1671311 RepID=UPI0027D4CF9C|nr:uncharacterized protein CABS01_16577 [Colletotrichum abscissum]KAK1519792.1 hypothetical protein CABS01_16577 [Colletotrichum abscissum]
MSFFATSYSNSDSGHVSQVKLQMAQELEKLFKSSSWDEALAIVGESQSLQSMGFQGWMSDLIRHQMLKETMERLSDSEMHNRLLAHAREEMTGVWQGWRAQDLTQQKLVDVYKTAVGKAREQPKLRNSVRFTIDRSIALQLRLSDEEDSHPTNIILLAASPLERKEMESLKKRLKAVKSGGSEFSIQVVLFEGNPSPDVMKYHHQLDDHQSGDRDIYSAISFNEVRVLSEGFSPLALMKILNGHSRAFTQMRLSEDQKYGSHAGGPFKLPTVPEVQTALGLATTHPDNGILVFSDPQSAVELKDAGDGKV